MIAPRGGFFTRDGKWAVENEGVGPDIEVENFPKDVIAGRDPQLERAIDEAMKLLKAEARRSHDDGAGTTDVGKAAGTLRPLAVSCNRGRRHPGSRGCLSCRVPTAWTEVVP